MSDLLNYSPSPLYPISLVTFIRQQITSFSRNSFEDAHELLIKLFELLQCNDLSVQIVNSQTCSKCPHFSRNDEELFGISATVSSKLSDSLSLFFSPSDTTWECPSCQRVTKSIKEITPILLPSILVVHIKRLKWSRNKAAK